MLFILFPLILYDSMPDSAKELSEFLSSLPYSYEASNFSSEIKQSYDKYEGKKVSVAGRIVGLRKSGKLMFADLLDRHGKIQVYFDYAVLGESTFSEAKKLNAGDIIGVTGTVMKTTKGEVSIKASEYSLLAKAIRTLPDKWHGLQDVETRYRKRHLDLIMNEEVRETFKKRSKIITLIREFLNQKDFIEFETPVIQPLYGGADAEPFKVVVNTLKEEHYLRISNELYLKRLLIGGFDKVYEIYKAFRNEDIDVTHSPEFTMIEWYEAYADYHKMMKLMEELLHFISSKLFDSSSIEYQDNKISFKAPFKRLSYLGSINQKVGTDVTKLDDEALFELSHKNGIRFEKGKRTRTHAYDKLFSLLVQQQLIQPTFVIDYPRASSPLTRPKRDSKDLVERFEFFMAGMEIANSYSELNNPIIQKENFENETKKMKEGDKEAEPLDMDFVEAMEQGMPPAGGLGFGIDRLVMVFTNKSSIKEVILFPMEKRGK